MAGLVEDHGAGQKPPICVDGRMLASRGTGVATYARAVIAAIASVGSTAMRLDDDTRGRFGVQSSLPARAMRWIDARRAGPLTLSAEPQGLWAPDVFRRAQARFDASGEMLDLVAPGRPGVMHWTYPIPARIVGWANVYTIHDVVPLTHPGLSDVDPEKLRSRIAAIVRSAARVVTVSDASRRAILSAIDVAPARVTDCGSAVVGMEPGDGTLPAGLRAGDYHLFCGMDEPRKNLPRIVAGWRRSGSTCPLVIAGPGVATPAEPGVIPVGYLPRPALIDLIAGARSLVFPTLEEGFGLPVIEAMALGTPVITTNRGALSETAGGAAVLVDPEDIGQIAAAIAAIDGDPAFATALRDRGLARARAFSLEAFGGRLCDLYAEIAGESGTRP